MTSPMKSKNVGDNAINPEEDDLDLLMSGRKSEFTPNDMAVIDALYAPTDDDFQAKMHALGASKGLRETQSVVQEEDKEVVEKHADETVVVDENEVGMSVNPDLVVDVDDEEVGPVLISPEVPRFRFRVSDDDPTFEQRICDDRKYFISQGMNTGFADVKIHLDSVGINPIVKKQHMEHLFKIDYSDDGQTIIGIEITDEGFDLLTLTLQTVPPVVALNVNLVDYLETHRAVVTKLRYGNHKEYNAVANNFALYLVHLALENDLLRLAVIDFTRNVNSPTGIYAFFYLYDIVYDAIRVGHMGMIVTHPPEVLEVGHVKNRKNDILEEQCRKLFSDLIESQKKEIQMDYLRRVKDIQGELLILIRENTKLIEEKHNGMVRGLSQLGYVDADVVREMIGGPILEQEAKLKAQINKVANKVGDLSTAILANTRSMESMATMLENERARLMSIQERIPDYPDALDQAKRDLQNPVKTFTAGSQHNDSSAQTKSVVKSSATSDAGSATERAMREDPYSRDSIAALNKERPTTLQQVMQATNELEEDLKKSQVKKPQVSSTVGTVNENGMYTRVNRLKKQGGRQQVQPQKQTFTRNDIPPQGNQQCSSDSAVTDPVVPEHVIPPHVEETSITSAAARLEAKFAAMMQFK